MATGTPGSTGGLDESKNVLSNFAKELSDALATNFSVKDIQNRLVEVDVSAMQIAKSFGVGRENVVNLKGAMTEAVIEVTKLGGSFQDISNIQKSIAETLNRNVILSSEVYPKIFAASSVAGVDAAKMVDSFKTAGISVYQTSTNMESIINTARKIGVNAQEVAEQAVKYMDKMNLYSFQNGVDGMAKMAAQATSMRIDMGKTFDFAERVFNPEGAIETAAALQRLGVAQSQLLDPLRLMDLAQNDPTELQNQMTELAKGFVELNEKGRFQIAPGEERRLREVASAMGMSSSELAKMAIGAKELDDKMQKIKFPDAIGDENRQFIANMAEMNEKGEYIIRYQNQDQNVNDVLKQLADSPDELKKFMEASKPKNMEELAKDQLNVLDSIESNTKALSGIKGYAVAGSTPGEKMIEASIETYKLAAESMKAFDIKSVKENFEQNSEAVLTAINKTLTGEGSVEDIFKALGSAADNTKDLMINGLNVGITNVNNSLNELGKTNNDYLNLVGNAINFASKQISAAENIDLSFGNKINEKNAAMNTEVGKVATAPNQTSTMTPNMNVTPTSTNSTVSMNVKLDAPANIDTAQVIKVFQDPTVQQAIIDAINKSQSNNGLTPGNVTK